MAFTHNGAFGAITTSTLPGAGAAAPVPGVARAQSEAELDRIGREFGMNLAINANPPQGFSLRMADGAGAVNELTTYQIMKGGYDGRTRLLAEFHRPHVKGLDDPFITLDFLGQDRVIERLLGPLPSTALPGSLEEWREKAAREQA
ncbi:MAG TPA: hypothetical protein VHB73_06895 [Alphaproteobacteria bacterium]|nr:hypothetical protein [Alphaproteobacteria bacterium]